MVGQKRRRSDPNGEDVYMPDSNAPTPKQKRARKRTSAATRQSTSVNEDGGKTGTLESRVVFSAKNTNSKKKDDSTRPVNINNVERDMDMNMPDSTALTGKNKKSRESRQLSSGGGEMPEELSRGARRTSDRGPARQQPKKFEQAVASEMSLSKKRKAGVPKAPLEATGKVSKKKKPRRVAPPMFKNQPDGHQGDAIDDGVDTLIKETSRFDQKRVEAPVHEATDDTSIAPANTSKLPKKRQARRHKLPPWSVTKHILMCRDLLRDARSINLDPKMRRMLRRGLDMQKDTKIAFIDLVEGTNFSWTPPPPLDAERSHAICDDVVELMGRSNVKKKLREAVLNTLDAYSKTQSEIKTTFMENFPQGDTTPPNIDEILAETATIKEHVTLAEGTLKRSIQQGRNTRVRHIHDGYWQLHSKDYIKTWTKAKNTCNWEPVLLLFRRSDCETDSGQRVHRCHVAGILIGEEELETHCLQIPKLASFDPVIAPTQNGRYIEGNEDDCHIDVVFLGHGCLKLRMPRRVIERPLLGKPTNKSEEMIDFYGVQILQKEERTA